MEPNTDIAQKVTVGLGFIVTVAFSAIMTFNDLGRKINFAEDISILHSKQTELNLQSEECEKKQQLLEVLLSSLSSSPNYQEQYIAFEEAISCIEDMDRILESTGGKDTYVKSIETIRYNYQNLLDKPQTFTPQNIRSLKQDVENFLVAYEQILWITSSSANYLVGMFALLAIDFSLYFMQGVSIIFLTLAAINILQL